MKKIIKKFWGVALLLVLLSTLLVGAVPQAAAMNYMWFSSYILPGSMASDTTLAMIPLTTTPATGFSITAVAQSGSTIVCAATDNITWAARFYRSTDGGVTWAQIIPVTAPAAAANYTAMAIAPDDPNIIAVVGTDALLPGNQNPKVVWVTKNGGTNWSQLTALNGSDFINDIAISPSVSGIHNITVGGNRAKCSGANNTGTTNAALLLTYNLDAVAPTWTAPTGWAVGGLAGTTDDVMAIAYSTNYLADYALLVDTVDLELDAPEVVNLPCIIALHCYSYNTNLWDALVEASFPRILESLAVTTANISNVTTAQIVLDPNFFLGDEAYQIGFIGTTMTNNVTGNIGGIYRIDYTSVGAANVLYQIYTGTSNSVAWDGTNLMTADLFTNVTMGPNLVRRSANGLSPLPTFSPCSQYKVPGTGYDTKLLFNATSGLGFAFSQGNGACVAKTTDYGKSFNGYKLVNSHFGDINDFWISPSGSAVYVLATDNVDMNLWKGTFAGFGYAFERVFILNHVASIQIASDPAYMVRADKDDPNNVYIGLWGGKTMFKSTDGGASWTVRSCSQNILDFAVQDANTVYVAVAGAGTVVRTTSGGLGWTDPPLAVLLASGGICSSMNLLSDNNVLVSGTLSGVAYTTDGSTWTYIAGPIFGAWSWYSLVDATGLANGDTIFLGNSMEIASWTIGASFMWNESATPLFGGVAPISSGLVYANGVLYTYDACLVPGFTASSNNMSRWLYPTNTILGVGISGATDTLANGAPQSGTQYNNAGKPIINMLKATTGNSMYGTPQTVLWARSANENKGVWTGQVADTLNSWTEFLFSATAAPTLNYPTENALIPINSINGQVATFNFQWTAPASILDTTTKTNYNYQIGVYLDEAGLNPIANLITPFVVPGNIISSLAYPSTTGAVWTFAPGTTYYWRVRTLAGSPVQSQWSAMQSFVVEQLVAIVPVIASPENGGEVSTVNPAFSWSPIANATSYRFELATDSDFTDVIYTVDPTTAGAAVPSTMELDRGAQYFWHVKTLTPLEGEWSATANFIVAELPPEEGPPVIVTTAPQPTITAIVSQPAATTTQIVITQEPEKVVNPSYIWAIIVVGAVLVIAVIVLIVRTRRSV